MKKILYTLLTLSILSCAPLYKVVETEIPHMKEFDYTPFYENGIKVFTQSYDQEKYYEVGKYEIGYISNTKIIGLREKTPENYFVSYELSSVKICQESIFITKDKIYDFVIKLVKDKGDAILNIETKQVPVLVYEYQGVPKKLYSDEIIFEFTILKSKK